MDKIHARIQESVYTKAEWEAANPVLLKGEKGFVSDDPNLFKIGDGVTAWNSLPWRGYTGTISQVTGDNENAVMSQKATVAAIQAEAQERNEADEQLNTAIVAEKNRAIAAEEANAQAIADEAARATAAEKANAQSINSLKERTNEISRVVVEDESEEIIIEDNNGNTVATINEDGADFIGLKEGGTDVVAAITAETARATAAEESNAQSINSLKERTNEISRVVVEDESDEIIIEDNNGNTVATINEDGLTVSGIKTGNLMLSNEINQYTDIEISSDDNITIEDGRCCSFIAGGSYVIKGTGNATINVSFVKKTFEDVSYGFMWSWKSQQIASLTAQGIKINMYDGSSVNYLGYNIQGGSFQRINKHDSSVDAIFEVSSNSDDTWSLLITKRAEKFIKPSVKPVCIVYDGGRWQGQVYWEGELYKIWDLHRKLDIPYAVALYSDQMNPESGDEYTCEEVRRDIESGLCEVIVRNAKAMSKQTDLEYLEAIKSERSLLEVSSKATILAVHRLTTLIYRCSIKDGADFIRQYPFKDSQGVLAYKYSDSPYKAIHSTGIPITLDEADNFWLPQIFWAHGVGIPPEGDTASYMYSDSTGVNTQDGFRNILSLAATGKVKILQPSDFSQYCKKI